MVKTKNVFIRIFAFSLFFILVFNYAGHSEENAKKVDSKTKNETVTGNTTKPEYLFPPSTPPPPPPVSVSEEVNKVVISDPYVIPEDVLIKMFNNKEKTDKILQEIRNLRYGTTKKETLKEVNFFYYHSQLPLVFFFNGKKIEKVIVYGSKSIKTFYKDDTIIFLPDSTSKEFFISSFVVLFEDGDTASFVGERSTLTTPRPVILRYSYVQPFKISSEEIIVLFFRSFNRCPEEGEIIKIGERHFKFHIKSDKLLMKKNEISACGKVYEIIEL